MRIDNKPLDLKVAFMFTQKSWCHGAIFLFDLNIKRPQTCEHYLKISDF